MLSRPIIEHLTRLALVYSVIEQIKAVPNVYAACKDDIEKLQKTHEDCKRELLEHYGFTYIVEPKRKDSDGIKMQLSDKDNRRLYRHEKRFVNWLMFNMNETILSTEWLTTVLDQCQVQHNTLPMQFSNMRKKWEEMHETLAQIYAVFDHNLEDVEAMRKGLKLSVRMPI